MFEITKHRLRQIRYRWFQFSEDPLYLLFEKMYQYDPRPLHTVTPHPGERGFLLTHFICPDFARYRGREITFFNARHVAVYWLPGAAHSGGGYVQTGTYSVTVGGHAVKRPVELRVSKNDDATLIHSAVLQTRAAKPVQGGFISFKIIAKELQCLAQQWFTELNQQLDAVRDTPQLRDIIQAARGIAGYAELNAQADLLHMRLQTRP